MWMNRVWAQNVARALPLISAEPGFYQYWRIPEEALWSLQIGLPQVV